MKAHVIGISGSGKSTLARRLSRMVAAPVYHLDQLVYDRVAGERPGDEIIARLDQIRARDAWVSEGAYREAWLAALLVDADVIVWLDVPLATCAVRMIKRHLRAEIARSNPHPGWRKLVRLLNYTRTTAGQQRRETEDLLVPYERRVVRCRTSADVDALCRAWH